MVAATERMLVVEVCGHEAAAVCASLLAGAGADLVRIELTDAERLDAGPAGFGDDTIRLKLDPGTAEGKALLQDTLARAHVVLISSDLNAGFSAALEPRDGQIFCDIRAGFGDGEIQEAAVTEWQLQAATGMLYTTGWPDAPPVPIAPPIINVSAGFYAVAAVLSCLLSGRVGGPATRIEVSMLATGLVTMNSYLAGVLRQDGCDPQRVGNRHTAVAPWNSYPARDGEIIICAGNQGQWLALCRVMEREDLALAYPDQASRLANVLAVDRAISDWTQRRTIAECEGLLLAVGVAAGPILSLADIPRDENLRHRDLVREEVDADGQPVRRVALPMGLRRVAGLSVPTPRAGVARPTLPLQGLRVVEMGQFTTAPLCGRILASMGAEVIKVEKSGGDEQRGWQQSEGRISETFWLNNTGKTSICLDLADQRDRERLEGLLARADLLVENFKPGTLVRFGLTEERLRSINPRLVHCAISGFGARSAYPGRPGFDMVIQGMSGFMVAVSPGHAPIKSSVSTADMMGAVAGLVASLGALLRREQTGRGGSIDLSMQDVSAWLTAPAWGAAEGPAASLAVLTATDGYVLIEGDAKVPSQPVQEDRATMSRRLRARGIVATPILSLREAVFSPAVAETGIWRLYPWQGNEMPVLGLPFRIDGQRFLNFAPAPELQKGGEIIHPPFTAPC